MSIEQLQARLERLNAKIESSQAQLTELKAQRKELKTQLDESKKAAKNGAPMPEIEPEGIVETITATVRETVVAPLVNLVDPKPSKRKRKS